MRYLLLLVLLVFSNGCSYLAERERQKAIAWAKIYQPRTEYTTSVEPKNNEAAVAQSIKSRTLEEEYEYDNQTRTQLKAMDSERERIYKLTGSGKSYYLENCPKQLDFLQRTANQGYAIAQMLIAGCYVNGAGVIKNESQAVYWYRKASEQNNAQAQFNLGVMYEAGSGVAKDESEAINLYRKAANQGLSMAETKLNNLLKKAASYKNNNI